jgi:hypothetical protein
MKHKLAALRSLSAKDLRLLGQAWLVLLLADLFLRVLPLPRVQQILAGMLRPGPRAAGACPSPRTARLVDVAARHHILPVRCLQRSLALQALLSRQGLDTELKIGVRKLHGSLHAHAWLEWSGVPVAENGDVTHRFSPLQKGA